MAPLEKGSHPIQRASEVDERRDALGPQAEAQTLDRAGLGKSEADEQAHARWAHHHPDDLELLETVQNNLLEMNADQLADQPEERPGLEGQQDGRETLFAAQAPAATPTAAHDDREQFFRRNRAQQQQEPTQARDLEEGMEH